ncbi:MAG: hypothetical protein A2Y76_02585 [Planctomycetes bacterium RBG_13_60_9]|nr:MAG: hypothetical protein A2Y76_02585 [Planctomycetes bacterium RBG_13_60_9]
MGWRTKFVFLLIVYFAGFATAIYCLSPAPQQPSSQPLPGTRTGAQPSPPSHVAMVRAALKSDDVAKLVNSGMHKCLGFSKEAAVEAAKLIQEKINEVKSQSTE